MQCFLNTKNALTPVFTAGVTLKARQRPLAFSGRCRPGKKEREAKGPS